MYYHFAVPGDSIRALRRRGAASTSPSVDSGGRRATDDLRAVQSLIYAVHDRRAFRTRPTARRLEAIRRPTSRGCLTIYTLAAG